jgi:hypothetical protein
MSSADDAAGDELGDGDGAVVHVADDLDEWLQRQRYQDIFTAKRSASDVLSQAAIDAGRSTGVRGVIESRQEAAERVTQFVIEIKRVFEDTERGNELYHNEHITTFRLAEVPQLRTTNFDTLTTLRGVEPIKQNGRFYYHIEGIEQYRNLTDTTTMIEWEHAGNKATRGFEEERQRFTPYPPVAVSRDVYEQATDLLGDVGLDLDIAEEEDNEWDL